MPALPTLADLTAHPERVNEPHSEQVRGHSIRSEQIGPSNRGVRRTTLYHTHVNPAVEMAR
jgi:hypothetical protein